MQIEQYKNALQEKHNELSLRVEALEKNLKESHSTDSFEQAQERENDEVQEALLRESHQELGLIKQALKRIDNGQYGICTDCGEDINPQRLDAYPEAEKCINCAS